MVLIVRGYQKGFTAIKNLVTSPKQTESFPQLFGKIVAKQRDEYLTKENGFHVFKLYKQRLFSTLYSTLLEMVSKMDLGTPECRSNHSRAVQLMMHLCSLVPISHIQDKL